MRLDLRFIGTMLGALLAMGQAPGTSSSTGTATLRVHLGSHTSVRVSTSELRFEVADPHDTPRLAVDYTAAARTRQGGDVVLTVEPVGDVRTPENAPADGLVVAYDAQGREGGTLAGGAAHVIGSWTGSGVRPGRVIFSLLGARAPGVYSLSLKFAVSAP